jgi:cytoskeleton protein RodZ
MTDERDKRDKSTEADNEPQRPLAGERLAEARRERQIGLNEVAKRLHLDEAKVRALERNDFDVLGAPVFAKGHLRKYAELVGIEKDDIIADYYRMTHMADLPPVVHDRPRLRQQMSPLPWVLTFLIVVVVGLGYWWFTAGRPGIEIFGTSTDDGSVPATPVDVRAENRPAEYAPVAERPDELPVTTVETAVVQEPAESTPEPESALPEALAAQPQEGSSPGQTLLSIRFSGDCWTEISDADGKRLFFDMGRAGRSVEVAGTAPFSILFGNSENVSLQVNGSDYPVSPNTPGSRTARLTVLRP